MLYFDVNHKTRVKIGIDVDVLLKELDNKVSEDYLREIFSIYYLEFKTNNSTRLTFEGPKLFTINHYHRSQSTSGL